ncbi:MAG: hypothetical protein WAW31_01775 [Smithella sp.]
MSCSNAAVAPPRRQLTIAAPGLKAKKLPLSMSSFPILQAWPTGSPIDQYILSCMVNKR